MRMMLKAFLLSIQILLLSSCGGGSDSSNNGGGSGLSGINGLLTASQNRISDNRGTITYKFSSGKIVERYTPLDGQNHKAYRHSREKMTFLQTCINYEYYIKQVSIINDSDSITRITPCITDYYSELGETINFITARLSPDESKLAVVLQKRFVSDPYIFRTIIYDLRGTELKRYKGFSSPSWLPDNRLLLLGSSDFGVYIADKGFHNEPVRVDNNTINSKITEADVSPSGKQVVFARDNRISIMDLDGTNLKHLPIPRTNNRLISPVWSPDGKYIACLRKSGASFDDSMITIHELASKKTYLIDTAGYTKPASPLSWVK